MNLFYLICEAVEPDEPLRFKKVPRGDYDLACPHCGKIMHEKARDFTWDEERGWSHHRNDGKTRKILPNEE